MRQDLRRVDPAIQQIRNDSLLSSGRSDARLSRRIESLNAVSCYG